MNEMQIGKAHDADKAFPGCLGRMVNLFDLGNGVSGNKLLTDKPHRDGSSLSRSQSDGGPRPGLLRHNLGCRWLHDGSDAGHCQQDAEPHLRGDHDAPHLHTHHRSSIVDQINQACRKFGFFQVTNHGIPLAALDRTISAIKAFHEQPAEVKTRVYRRDMVTGVNYAYNFDLYSSKAASWRDTLAVRLGPTPANPLGVPEICRDAVAEWDQESQRLGGVLMELVSEGLGLNAWRLREMTCLEGRMMVGHYYPYCPQPDLTVGIASHSDPGVLTVLLQDQTGGLQVKYGEGWLDVKPVPGALVINVGDLLQIMSNGEYKSVDHRVLANPKHEARVAIAVFFRPSNTEDTYGPLSEMVSPEKPALYQQFTLSELLQRFFKKGLDGKALVNHFRL